MTYHAEPRGQNIVLVPKPDCSGFPDRQTNKVEKVMTYHAEPCGQNVVLVPQPDCSGFPDRQTNTLQEVI